MINVFKKALLHDPGKPESAMKSVVALRRGSVILRTQCVETQASLEVPTLVTKISIINVSSVEEFQRLN
jgi:hypothetical protein